MARPGPEGRDGILVAAIKVRQFPIWVAGSRSNRRGCGLTLITGQTPAPSNNLGQEEQYSEYDG
ncbi:hypothetical protein ES708_02315 [subsurface metagenome]